MGGGATREPVRELHRATNGDVRRALASHPADNLAADAFPTALRTAIQASGLSLDRIQYRLRARGVSVSVTALSYWQSGRRRPERAESLAALGHLESVLGVAPGSLIALTRPAASARPRAARVVPAADRGAVARARAGLEAAEADRLHHRDRADQAEPARPDGRRRRPRREAHRRAPGRCAPSATASTGPSWSTTWSASAARSRRSPRCSLPHRPGRPGRGRRPDRRRDRPGLPPRPRRHRDRRVRAEPPGAAVLPRRRQLLPQVHHPRSRVRAGAAFDPRALPAYCELYTVDPDEQTTTRRKVEVNAAGEAHAVALDFGPGTFCVRWDWPRDRA